MPAIAPRPGDGGGRGLGRPAGRRCCWAALRAALAGLARRRHRRAEDGGAGLRGLVAAAQAGGARLCRCAAPLSASCPASAAQLADAAAAAAARGLHRRRRARLQPRPGGAAAARRHQARSTSSARRSGPGAAGASSASRAASTMCCACSRSSPSCCSAPASRPPTSAIRWPTSIPLQVPRAEARQRLGLGEHEPVVALLPGSRAARSAYIAPAFLQAAACCCGSAARPALRAAGGAGPARRCWSRCSRCMRRACRSQLLDGRSHDALAACDVTLIASGTATLEAALFKRPMVIGYRMHWLSWQLMKRMSYQPWVGPAQHPVPRVRRARTAAGRLPARRRWPTRCWPSWTTRPAPNGWPQRFTELHLLLRRDTARCATDAIAKSS